MTFQVVYDDLALLRQVFERQAEHVERIASYVEQHCAFGDVSGVVLALMRGQYDAGRQNATTGLAQGTQIARSCAKLIRDTEDGYVAADKASWERSKAQIEKLGGTAPPWQDPRSSARLPVAATSWDEKDGELEAREGYKDVLELVKGVKRVVEDPSARWFTPGDADWIDRTPTDPLGRLEKSTKLFSVDHWRDTLTDTVTGRHDSGTPGYLAESQRFREGFASGQGFAWSGAGHGATYEPGVDGSRLGPRSVWANDAESTMVGTAGAGLKIYDGVTSVVGAVSSVGSAVEAGEQLGRVQDPANDPANTGAIDWANGGSSW